MRSIWFLEREPQKGLVRPARVFRGALPRRIRRWSASHFFGAPAAAAAFVGVVLFCALLFQQAAVWTAAPVLGRVFVPPFGAPRGRLRLGRGRRTRLGPVRVRAAPRLRASRLARRPLPGPRAAAAPSGPSSRRCLLGLTSAAGASPCVPPAAPGLIPPPFSRSTFPSSGPSPSLSTRRLLRFGVRLPFRIQAGSDYRSSGSADPVRPFPPVNRISCTSASSAGVIRYTVPPIHTRPVKPSSDAARAT